MRGIKPGGWLALTMLSAFLLVMVFFQRLSAGGLDVAEACALRAGQPYDHEYHVAHPREQIQLFPLTAKCNAEYDLVPLWINPGLTVLATLTVLFFGATLAAQPRRLKTGSGACSPPAS